MQTQEQADAAIKELNGANFNGANIVVERGRMKDRKPMNNNRGGGSNGGPPNRGGNGGMMPSNRGGNGGMRGGQMGGNGFRGNFKLKWSNGEKKFIVHFLLRKQQQQQ